VAEAVGLKLEDADEHLLAAAFALPHVAERALAQHLHHQYFLDADFVVVVHVVLVLRRGGHRVEAAQVVGVGVLLQSAADATRSAGDHRQRRGAQRGSSSSCGSPMFLIQERKK
jgi:hypothetical protein